MTCGWYGNGELRHERADARTRWLEQLAVDEMPSRDADEHHRGDRAERAGAAQPCSLERRCRRRDLRRCSLDARAGRRRSPPSAAAASRAWGSRWPAGRRTTARSALQLGAARLGDGDGDADRRFTVTGAPALSAALDQRAAGSRAGRRPWRASRTRRPAPCSAPSAEERVELGRVVEELAGALPERGDEVDDDLGQILLEVAVAACPRTRSSRSAIAAPVSARVDRQQVGDAGLVLRVEDDLAAGVGDRRSGSSSR